MADLRPDRPPRRLLADVGARDGAQRGPQPRRRRLEREQGAHRVEQEGFDPRSADHRG
jgi:hypothetical protein